MRKFLYVFEFSNNKNDVLQKDNLWNAVWKCLEERDSIRDKVKFKSVHGIFRSTHKNGMSIVRFVNFIWMHISSFFQLLVFRPDFVFVRTSPPLIQITYLIFGRVFRAKTYVWLMDYHPLVVLRIVPKWSLRYLIFALLDKIDKFALKYAEAIICLDNEMEDLIKKRAPFVRTFVCPTFSLDKVEWLDLSKERKCIEDISFLYSGNLGVAHDTSTLSKILSLLSTKVKVVFSYCGDSDIIRKRFEKICETAKVEFRQFPRVESYRSLGAFYKDNKFDYGVILLRKDFAGIVSPSKFSGYTSFGLPVIYIGPSRTNAGMVCTKFNAGILIDSDSNTDKVVELLLNSDTQPNLARHTKDSITYFGMDAAFKLTDFFEKELVNL